MHWPLYVALAALALGAALAGLRESAAVPWFMVAVGLVASVFGLGAGLAALGLASLLLFFQGAMNPSSLAALLLAALLAHQVGESLRRAHRRAKYLAQTHRLLAEALEALPKAQNREELLKSLPERLARLGERGHVGVWVPEGQGLRLLAARPQLRTLLVHNIDTLGATLDPALVGWFQASGAALGWEVIPRRIEDHGGGLARVDGRMRLIEGLALPRESDEFNLTYYNTNSCWIDIDRLLTLFGLTRAELADSVRTAAAVRTMAARVPTYVTLKDVKKRWGHGQEDVYPVAQFEKLWGDMTGLTECANVFAAVPRHRGQQLKDQAQLDSWARDGSAAGIAAAEAARSGRSVHETDVARLQGTLRREGAVFERGLTFQEEALAVIRARFRAPVPPGPRAYERLAPAAR